MYAGAAAVKRGRRPRGGGRSVRAWRIRRPLMVPAALRPVHSADVAHLVVDVARRGPSGPRAGAAVGQEGQDTGSLV